MTHELKIALEKERLALVGYIRGIVRNAEIAEDLSQETMLRAHLGVSELRDRLRLIPWLYRIATNACRDYFRKQKRLSEQLQNGSDTLPPHNLSDENAPQLGDLSLDFDFNQPPRPALVLPVFPPPGPASTP